MAELPVAQLRDLRARVRGLLPRNMQSRIVAGIAGLMTLVILFSGRSTHPPTPSLKPAAGAQTSESNQARIQEYRAGIDAATRQLAAEEAELVKAKESLAGRSPATASTGISGSSAGLSPTRLPASRSAYLAEPIFPSAQPPSREAQSLFASNIALTYRNSTPGAPAAATQNTEPKNPPAAATESQEPRSYRLFEGTIIETVLTNRLDSTFSGPVDCLVTTDVFSPERDAILIPAGSRILGEVKKLESLGDQRLAVFFHRLLRPDGYSASLDKFRGLSSVGETGLRDQVNHHYLQVFGASLAIGAVAGLAQSNSRYGLNESGLDAYEQGVAGSLSQSSMHVLDRYLNVLPTFTIREGHRIKVYLSQDLTLPAYNNDLEKESTWDVN